MKNFIKLFLFLLSFFSFIACSDRNSEDLGISFDSKRAEELMLKYKSGRISPEEADEMMDLGCDLEFQMGDFLLRTAENAKSIDEYWNILENAQKKFKSGQELVELLLKHSPNDVSIDKKRELLKGYDYFFEKSNEADDLIKQRFGDDIY